MREILHYDDVREREREILHYGDVRERDSAL